MTDQDLAHRMVANIKIMDTCFSGAVIDPRTRQEQIDSLIASQMRCEATYPEGERISLEQMTRVAPMVIDAL